MKISQLFERKTNPNQQPRRCCHRRQDGTECSAYPQRGSQYCFFHNPDPAQEAQRRQASSAGGRASTRPLLLPPDLPVLSLKTASDVASLLEETTNQVRRGEMDLRAATTICYIANSLVHALEVASRAERQSAQENRASRKKHPAPLKLTVYDHTGRIIDQIPPDATPAPFPGTVSLRTASSNTPTPKAEQGVSAERAPDAREQSARAGSPSSPVLARWGETAQQRSVAEPLDKTPTASSNTPSPSPEQGMSPARTDADQRGFVQNPSAMHLLATENRQLGTVSKSNTPSPTPSAEQGMEKPQPSAPLLRTENRELRTAVQYPPGLGPRHLGPGPGGSLMAGTPSVPWWRRRQRINPDYITGMARQTAEIEADAARSKRWPR